MATLFTGCSKTEASCPSDGRGGQRLPRFRERTRCSLRGCLLALTLAAACLCLLAAAPSAHAGWPSHSTRWQWSAFQDGAPGYTAWGTPQTFTNALAHAMDVIPWGDTYVFYWSSNDGTNYNLYSQAFDLGSGSSPTVTTVGDGAWAGLSWYSYLGACSTGNDIFVFSRQKAGTLSWVQASENYNTNHSAAADWVDSISAPDDQLTMAVGHTPGFDFQLLCDVAYIGDGIFAFVSPDPTDKTGTTYNVFLSDLSGIELPDHKRSFTPYAAAGTSASAGVLRDVQAMPFAYQGRFYLAVASLFGHPGDVYEGWCPQPGDWNVWDSMTASIYLSSFTEQGFDEPVVDRVSWQPASNGPYPAPSGVNSFGATDIRLVRGGAYDGPTGDQLSALVRTCYVAYDAPSATDNFQFEFYENYQLAVGANADGETPQLSSPSRDVAYLQRQPQQDNNKNNFAIWNPTTTSFFVWAQPEQGVQPVTQGVYPYFSWQQRIWLAASAGVTLWEQGGSKSTYSGTIGSVVCLGSDALKPVPYDTTDEDGDPLPAIDPVTGQPLPTVNGAPALFYPATPAVEDMSAPNADASQCVLDGVAYGSPPFAPNGWNDANPPGVYSALTFGTTGSTDTSSADENKGGISLGFSWKEGGDTRGFDQSVGASAGWGIDKSTAQTTSSVHSETWSTEPAGAYGQIYFTQPAWEVQRFAREDWEGTLIPNEYLMATNCADNNKVEGAFAFNMTAPGSADPLAPLNTYFSGMTGAPATDDVAGWHQRVDPVTMAGSHGAVVQQPDGTKLEASVTGNALTGTLYQTTFTQSTAKTDATANSVNVNMKILFVKASYSHTWSNSTSTSTGSSFEFSWRVPPQGVTVPDVIGEQVQDGLNALAAAGLRPAVLPASGTAASPGTIVSQSPLPGSQLTAKSSVTVFIAPLPSGSPAPIIPTPATIVPDVNSMTVEGVWMEAKDDQAYWIPDAYRNHEGGESQKPWCVDWSVLAYTTPGVTAASASDGLSCDVKVRARPVHGGSAHVLKADASAGHFGTAKAEGIVIAATPATGYRFAGWQLHGANVARIEGAQKPRARVIPKATGGVTATARFVRIEPRLVGVERIDADSAHVRVDSAPLARAYPGPELGNARTSASAQAVTVKLGDDLYRVPAAAWRPLARSAGKTYRFGATFHPRTWDQRDDCLTVTIDTRANRFSVQAHGADGVDELYRGVAAGRLDVALLVAGKTISHASYPVTGSARFTHDRAAGALLASSAAGWRRPVRLRGAELLVYTDPQNYRKSRLVVSNAVIDPALLNQDGFVLDINGIYATLGAARRSGSTFVARGRSQEGIQLTCRWSEKGRATISLAGGYLERELAGMVGRNLVVGVGDGDEKVTGTMVIELKTLSELAVAPRLSGD